MNFHANDDQSGPSVRGGFFSTFAEWQAALSAIWICAKSILRGLPLLVSRRPKTPLRALCLTAVDAIHLLRKSEHLPKSEIRTLAAWLDFAACANAAIDQKDFCRKDFRKTLQLLKDAGIRSSVAEYLRRLRELERSRPSPRHIVAQRSALLTNDAERRATLTGHRWQFQSVRLYREAVVRLSLGTVLATGMNQSIDEGIQLTYSDRAVEILFRTVMQCQIIDDVLDYAKDAPAGLPSFLTAGESLQQAVALTRLTVLEYADDRDLPRSGDVFPFRLALRLVSTCAELVILCGIPVLLCSSLGNRSYSARQVVVHGTAQSM